MKFKSFLAADAADFPDFSEIGLSARGAGFALSLNAASEGAGADATFGTLAQLANFMITGYWASQGGQLPRQWQSTSISVNITQLTPAEQVLARDALADWAAVANLNFTFTDGPASITFNDLPLPVCAKLDQLLHV
jgi:hypothetical protein